jgi:hypothetical protein
MLFDTGNKRHHGSLSATHNNKNRSPSIYDNLAVTITTTKEANGYIS